MATRLPAPLPRATPAPSRVAEPAGRPDRKDLAVFALLVIVTFGTRVWRLELPRTEYFDEYWHATTATEFLQDWRYGIPHTISEWTHPHLAKYAMAIGIAALGDNTAHGAGTIGAPVRDVVLVPARAIGADPARLVGDQLVIATGADVRIAAHGRLDAATVVPLAGSVAVAADPGEYRAFVGTDEGAIYALDGSSLDATTSAAATPRFVGRVVGRIVHLWVADADRLIAQSSDDLISVVDLTDAAVLASAHVAGISGLRPVTSSNGSSFAVVAIPSGLEELDLETLSPVATLALPAAPTGLDLVDGSAQGHRERELLFQPTLYVATGAARIETAVFGPDGSLLSAGGFAMPGSISDVRWDRTTNLVHVLGKTRDGQSTIYVVDPHSNAVFADATLPFVPSAWTLDIQPGAPSLDRQQALAFSATGEIEAADVGNNAFAWRLPGVVAGALMAGFLYLLTRLLFRRRSVGLLVAAIVPAEGLLFAQSRIAMNDAYAGLFIVAAFALLAYLLQSGASGWRARLELIAGLPALGVLLGLALASKWVGAYAIGGVVLLVLLRSPLGRWLAFAGMIGLTTVFGYLAVADTPSNLTFFLLMLALTALFAVAMARRGSPLRSLRHEPIEARWVEPRWRRGLPFGWALFCLTVLPLAVYVLSYVPWATGTAGGPQLLAGWPPGHAGQTFLDLQAQMYRYHNELRAPHGASSPWWAWPLDLKPIWAYLEGFVDGSQSTILATGNLVLLWLAIPAVAFGAWQAWRRRGFGLIFAVVAFFCLWLPWARVDRVAYNYHYYAALPFALVLLAYFLAELWDGASAWTWLLARAAAIAALLGPAILWMLRTPLCGLAGVDVANPGAPVCAQPASAYLVPVTGWWIAALIASAFVWRLRRARWLVVGVVIAAIATFAVLYPALAAWPVPDGVAWIYQGLLPTWDSSFYFNNNQTPVIVIPLLSAGLVMVFAVSAAVAAGAMRWASAWGRRPPLGPVAKLRGAMERRAEGSQAVALAERAPATGDDSSESAMASSSQLRFASAFNATRAVQRPGWPSATGRYASALDRFGIPLALFGVSAIVYAWINNGRPAYYDYFVPLADAFLHGHLGLPAMPEGFTELVRGTNNLWNVVYPPMPAVIVMPIVLAAGTAFEQSWASILLGAVNVALVSVVLRHMGVARRSRIVLSLAFAFGTIVWYSAQLGTAWHFAHVVAMFFTLLAIVACMRDWPTLITGLLFGAAVLSRLPVVLAAPFFLAYMADRAIRESAGGPAFGALGSERILTLRDRFPTRRFLELAIPWAIGASILAVGYLAYNLLRFGSISETGHALVPQGGYFDSAIFTFASVPRLFIAMFLSGPAQVDGFPFFQPRIVGGLSILLTSPIFLWAFRSRRLTWFNVGAWLSIVLVLIPIILHAEEGGSQFGFRYAQDIYPFLFIVSVIGLGGRISRMAWAAILIGVIVNVWGMVSAYNGWWSLSIPDSQVPVSEIGSLPIVALGGLLLGLVFAIRLMGRWVVMPAAADGGMLGMRLIGYRLPGSSNARRPGSTSAQAASTPANELPRSDASSDRGPGRPISGSAGDTPIVRAPISALVAARLAWARALAIARAPTSRRVTLLGLIPAWLLFVSSDTVPLVFDAQQYYNLAGTWANGNILPPELLFRGYSTGLFLIPAVLLARITSIPPELAVLLEMSAVLAVLGWIVLPRLEALALRRSATLADRVVSVLLLYVLWGGYSSAGLTDFPALALFLVAMLMIWQRGSAWLLPAAGLLAGLAFNLRPAYVLGMAGLVVLAALTGSRELGPRLRRGALVAVGVAVALTPQAMLNASQGLPAVPPTPGTTAQFLEFQLQTGLYFQRYETAQDPSWPSPQIFACDPGGIALVVASGKQLPSTLDEYVGILASQPIAGAALITRRVANLLWLDNRSAYVTDVSGRGVGYGLLNVLLVGLFAALVVVRVRQFPRLGIVSLVALLACAPAIISIPDLRFFLPLSAVAIASFVPAVSWLASATPRIRVAVVASCVLLILATSAIALEARALEIPGLPGNANPSCFASNVAQ